MPILVRRVTTNIHERTYPFVDHGKVMLAPTAEYPVIVASVPCWVTQEELPTYERAAGYLRRRASFVRDDRCFGQGDVKYFWLQPHRSWLLGSLAAPRRYESLCFEPELFMLMDKARGVPTVTGNDAIMLVNWLRETFTALLTSRPVLPKFASVEVKSIGELSSVIEITVDEAYAGLLIGKGGATINAIRKGIAAMYWHGKAIVKVKTV